MNPAEFKALRESLGLSAQWLATHFTVSLRTIQYWESATGTPPERVSAELLNLEDFVEGTADDAIERLRAFDGDEQVYAVPRIDADSPDDLPASLYRAVGARVRAGLADAELDYL